jgi:type IV secretion system protein VirB9
MKAVHGPMAALATLGALCSLGCGGPACAETVPPRGRVDARVRVVTYDEAEVYKLRGVVGFQIDLQFEQGESFTGLGAGDIEGLSFVGQENHLFLKPRVERVATNLTVLTNRRHYQIDYLATPRRATADGEVIYALRFTYPIPPEKLAADADARRVDAGLKSGLNGRTLNLDYWYCGAPTLRPANASDDGVHTRLKFPPDAELPAIFVRNDDDSESLVNFSMEDGEVVIHRVGRRYLLRRGKLTGCVVNRSFKGGGTRLESGTVAPDVERRVRGGPP